MHKPWLCSYSILYALILRDFLVLTILHVTPILASYIIHVPIS